ncbi:hypothetical protein [Demequina aestuarii]|uniref:hypothetical protein n=1 Tax=Demequina aestuarii TaxID=327095 RepID=UPI000784610F|nr:hypothetical protein [Demequina aestuarii]
MGGWSTLRPDADGRVSVELTSGLEPTSLLVTRCILSRDAYRAPARWLARTIDVLAEDPTVTVTHANKRTRIEFSLKARKWQRFVRLEAHYPDRPVGGDNAAHRCYVGFAFKIEPR